MNGRVRGAPHTREKLNTLEPTFLLSLPVCLLYLSVVRKPVQIFPCIGWELLLHRVQSPQVFIGPLSSSPEVPPHHQRPTCHHPVTTLSLPLHPPDASAVSHPPTPPCVRLSNPVAHDVWCVVSPVRQPPTRFQLVSASTTGSYPRPWSRHVDQDSKIFYKKNEA
jgi:hypothetical protein